MRAYVTPWGTFGEPWGLWETMGNLGRKNFKLTTQRHTYNWTCRAASLQLKAKNIISPELLHCSVYTEDNDGEEQPGQPGGAINQEQNFVHCADTDQSELSIQVT